MNASDFNNWIVHRLRWGLMHIVVFAMFLAIVIPAVGQEETEEEFVQEGTENKDVKPSADPYELFRKGQEAHEKGELDAALRLYSEALDELPEFPEAEYQIGTIYRSRGMLAQAEQSFRNALAYKRDWTLAMTSLGTVLILNGKSTEAKSVLEKAIRLDAMSYGAYASLTDLYIIDPPGEEEVRGLYSKIIYLTSKARTPASIWACRATLERLLGMTPAALESVNRSIAIEPGNLRARFEQVELLITSSDLDGATAAATALVESIPEDTGAKLLLARALALNGKNEKALNVLTAIIEPNSSVIALIATIQAAGEVDFAKLELQLETTPDDVQLLGALCSALRRSKPLDALRYCRRAYELDRGNIAHAVGYGAALVQLRNFAAAIRLLEEIKVRFPDNYTVRANLATAYFQSSNFEKAKDEYKWITVQRPELPAGYYFLAITYDRLQEYVDAFANYQQFLSISSEPEFSDEISRVNLRMPILQRQIKDGKGKKN